MKNTMRRSMLLGVFTLLVQFAITPLSVQAVSNGAPNAQYELKSWKMGVNGDSASINIGYIGSDGGNSTASITLGIKSSGTSLVEGHENEPSWTGYDSAAPILAYIKKYGVNSTNIQRIWNGVEKIEPTVFKALAGQGINLKQLGGPDVPPGSTPLASLVGNSVYPKTIEKVIVGVGIPAPDFSTLLGTLSAPKPITTPSTTTTSASKSTTSSLAPPPATKTTPKSEPTTQNKVGTSLNPVSQATKPPEKSEPNPERLDPPVTTLADNTPTKIEEPQASSSVSPKSNWIKYAEIGGGAGILLVGIVLFVKLRYKK